MTADRRSKDAERCEGAQTNVQPFIRKSAARAATNALPAPSMWPADEHKTTDNDDDPGPTAA